LPGTSRFTLQRCRVCRACFEADLPDAAARAKAFPTTTLDAFLPAPAADASAASGAAPRTAPPLCAYVTRATAKHCFLLTDKQVAALPCLQLRGDMARRTGILVAAGVAITLLTAGDCLRAAVARFGSLAALAAASAAKREEARAALEDSEPGGKLPAALKATCNLPHLNQSRHGQFTHLEGLGLQYAVRPRFLRAAGATVWTVAAPGDATAAAARADFVSLGAALAAAAPGDVIELLPGLHRTDTDAEGAADRESGTIVRKAVTIRGTAGHGHARPTLLAEARVLTVINSCALEHLRLRAVPVGNAFYPLVLVCNLYEPGHNRDVHVTLTDCILESPHPGTSALVARTQAGALPGRTHVLLRGCEISPNVQSLAGAVCSVADDFTFDGRPAGEVDG
jgi:hypothetical protein